MISARHMPASTQELDALVILDREQRRVEARRVLDRPTSMLPTVFIMALVAAIGTYLLGGHTTGMPGWVGIVLVTGVAYAIVSMMDAWTMRRRLEAAIVLIQLQEEALAGR